MPYTTPYVSGAYREEPYNNRRVGRLADLIRARGDVEAQGIRQQGDISAQMWGGIGQTVANTVGQLAQYKADQPKREHEQLLMAEQKRAMADATKFRGLEQLAGAGQMDPDATAKLYRQEGFSKEATSLEDHTLQRKSQQLTLVNQELQSHQAALSQSAKKLSALLANPDPMAQAAGYDAMVPELRRLAGPKDAANVPQQFNADAVKVMVDYGTTLADKTNLAQLAAAEAARAMTLQRGSNEQLESYTKALAMGLKTADTAEEWDQAHAFAKQFLPKDAMAQSPFPEKFSPEAMQHVRATLDAMDGKQDDLSMLMSKWASEHGGRQPNLEETLKIKSRLTDATTRFNPNAYGGGGRKTQMTPTQLRAADVWKKSQDNKVAAALASGEIEEGDAPRLLEAIQSEYLIRRGDPDGPSLAEYNRVRGGAPATTTPTTARPTAPPTAPPIAPPIAATGAPPVAAPAAPTATPPRGKFRVTNPATGKIFEYDTREQQAAAQAIVDASTKPQAVMGPPAPPAPQPNGPQEPQPATPTRPVAPPPSGQQVLVEFKGRRGLAYESEVPALIAAGYRVVESAPPRRRSLAALVDDAEWLDTDMVGAGRKIGATTGAVKQELRDAWGRFKRDVTKK